METNALTKPFNPDGLAFVGAVLHLASETGQDISFLTDNNGKHIILTTPHSSVKISPIPTTCPGIVWCDVSVDIPGSEKLYATLSNLEIIEHALDPLELAAYIRAPK